MNLTRSRNDHAPTQRRPHRILFGLAALAALALLLHGPIPQWAGYHDFADQRGLPELPHAADVLSNLPFALIGLWAWWRLGASAADPAGTRPAWRWFAASLVCTALGSSLYHWAPDNKLLCLDRLPIAWACTALLCAFLAEHLDPRWALPCVLMLGAALATASVLGWWWGEAQGQGDLRLYLFVQGLPMLLVPAGLLLRLPTASGAATAEAWWGVLLAYAAAKLFELADRPVFEVLGGLSGHTLKHLLAAAAAAWILRAVLRARSAAASAAVHQLR